MVDKALAWLDDHQAYAPDKPFFMYWAPGAAHGPHHIFPEWADKYKGKFDDGWDAYRERVYKRQLEMGIIPPGTKLTPRDATMPAWADIPEDQRAFQRAAMELFAGFVEHTDAQVGRLVDGLEARGLRDNTLIFYICRRQRLQSPKASRARSANCWRRTTSPTPWSSSSPRWKGSAASTRSAPRRPTTCITPAGPGPGRHAVSKAPSWSPPISAARAIRWSFRGQRRIKPDRQDALPVPPCGRHRAHDLRSARHHAAQGGERLRADNDRRHAALPTPSTDADAPPRSTVQFFDNNGSRGIYKDGWFACAFRPVRSLEHAPASVPRIAKWDSATDEWELYNLQEDFSQANNLAPNHPEKLAELKKEFLDSPKTTRTSPSARAIGCGFIPRPGQDSLYGLDLQRQHPAHARVHRARSRPRKQHS